MFPHTSSIGLGPDEKVVIYYYKYVTTWELHITIRIAYLLPELAK